MTRPLDMAAILERIRQRLDALDMTATAASMQATGSKDTIRNWQRNQKAGKAIGATAGSLGHVARALKCSPEWLIYGAEMTPHGLAEPVAEPFDATRRNHGPSAAAAALAAQQRHPLTYIIRRAVPALSYLPGDILVLETQPPHPDNSPVVATVTDENANPRTIIAWAHGDILLDTDATADAPVIRASSEAAGQNIGILGRIVGLVR